MVHAGLDLLLSEVKEVDQSAEMVPVSRSTVELIHHVHSSSESAIEILDALLQYEQIDAGESESYCDCPVTVIEVFRRKRVSHDA